MKHYLKVPQWDAPDGMGWRIVAGDDDVGDATIAHLDTETLADCLMASLTTKAPPFETNKAYEAITLPATTREWQPRDVNVWVFGDKVRGVVRRAKAAVAHEAAMRHLSMATPWRWCVFTDDGNESKVGHTATFTEAVAAAESLLGAGL